MAKIVHMASTHRVSDPRIFQKECKTLVAAVHEVVYIVPHTQDEIIDGVQIKAVTPPGSGKDRLLRTTRQVYRRALEEDPSSFFHLHDYDLVPYGFMLKMRGRRVVYDSHEDTPKQMQYQHWIPSNLRPLAGAATGVMERIAGRYFDAIIAAEPANARRYPHEKTALIHNYPLKSELLLSDVKPYQDRDFVVSYVGGLTEVRGLWEMVEMMRLLQDSESELLLGGPFFPASLEQEFRKRAQGLRITTPGYLNRREVAEVMNRSRVGIVLMHPLPKHIECLPTKLFEYMAVGLPVVVSDFPDWRAIIEDADCGILVDPTDASAAAGAVRRLFENPDEAEAMGARGRRAVEERFNWEMESQKLLDFYDRLAGKG